MTFILCWIIGYNELLNFTLLTKCKIMDLGLQMFLRYWPNFRLGVLINLVLKQSVLRVSLLAFLDLESVQAVSGYPSFSPAECWEWGPGSYSYLFLGGVKGVFSPSFSPFCCCVGLIIGFQLCNQIYWQGAILASSL